MTLLRTIVLVEPYGPNDLSIFTTIHEAERYTATLREQETDYRLFETTGTVGDLRSHQRLLRAEYVQRLADRLTVETAATA